MKIQHNYTLTDTQCDNLCGNDLLILDTKYTQYKSNKH